MTITALAPNRTADRWGPCPNWCQPDQCRGGGTFHGITTVRVHMAVHYAAAAPNPDFPRHLTNIELATIQVEDPDTGLGPMESVLRIGDRSIAAGPIAAGLADALKGLR